LLCSPTKEHDTTIKNSQHTLTSDQLDAIILAACTLGDDAIEESEMNATEAVYFLSLAQRDT
jgi:hypothetical protein